MSTCFELVNKTKLESLNSSEISLHKTSEIRSWFCLAETILNFLLRGKWEEGKRTVFVKNSLSL